MQYRIALVDKKGKVVYVSTIEPPDEVSLEEAMPLNAKSVKLIDLDKTPTYDEAVFGPVVYGDTWDGKQFAHASFEHLDGLMRQWAEEAHEVARTNALEAQAVSE